ncbi:MAG: hypothetical protein LBK95_18400, partial [Bifidobacteriaceae bacterium]|nr:hypothetical protein [Bifidobacteriaceae bacterium]
PDRPGGRGPDARAGRAAPAPAGTRLGDDGPHEPGGPGGADVAVPGRGRGVATGADSRGAASDTDGARAAREDALRSFLIDMGW